jgi:hypothetical protein
VRGYDGSEALRNGAFVYLLGRISVKDVECPATTQVGYVRGSGGRAVIYADGYVEWLPE